VVLIRFGWEPQVHINGRPRLVLNAVRWTNCLSIKSSPPPPLRKLRMKLTLAQNLPLRTYIINSTNEILYQVSTPDNGAYTTIARKPSTTPTSDTASEHTLVESRWYQLARLYWNNPESSQIHILALAQRQDNFKSISR
jgi:hypothetical protein